MAPSAPIPVYLLSSPKDHTYLEELEKQLAVHHDLLSYWSSSQVLAGETVSPEIERRLHEARLVVWLISPDFRFREEHGPEAKRALDLERAGALRIVPVLIRVTTHYAASYVGRPVLPDNKVPVSGWGDRDSAWRNVVAGIRKAAQELVGVEQGYSAVVSSRPVPNQRYSAIPESGAQSMSPYSLPMRQSARSVPPYSAPIPSQPAAPPAPVKPAQPMMSGQPLHGQPAAPPKPAGRKWPWAVLALLGAAGLGYWVLMSPGEQPALAAWGKEPLPAAADTGACCGGIDCPKARQDSEGSMCSKSYLCQKCKSGRRVVAGACATLLAPTDVYKLRLGGVTLPDYKYDQSDTICVQSPGGTTECATISEATTAPLLGTVSVSTLTSDPGINVWFDRGGKRMYTLPGVRIDHRYSTLIRSALCIGVGLHRAGNAVDKSEALTVYLDDP